MAKMSNSMDAQYGEIVEGIADGADGGSNRYSATVIVAHLSAQSANASQQLPQDSSHSLIELN